MNKNSYRWTLLVSLGKSSMDAIKGTIRSGRLELKTPEDWPDGTEVTVEPIILHWDRIGIDESEWKDDAESLADWDSWIKTIEPFEFTPEEIATNKEFERKVREYSIEAVRRQMQQRADG